MYVMKDMLIPKLFVHQPTCILSAATCKEASFVSGSTHQHLYMYIVGVLYVHTHTCIYICTRVYYTHLFKARER